MELVRLLTSRKGVSIESTVPIRVYNDSTVLNSSGCIIIIDESVDGIYTSEFHELLKNSDNYFIIISRFSLFKIPYSVKEIYEFRSSSVNRLGASYILTKNVLY